jgi:hypothetical protein
MGPLARVSAGLALLDRAYGRPASFSTTDPSAFKRAIELSDAELIQIAAAGGINIDAKSLSDYPEVTPSQSPN